MDRFTKEQITEFKESFALFDKDGDGSITTKEFFVLLRSLGQNPTEAEISSMVIKYDLNINGSVDFPEFLNLVAQRYKHPDDELEDLKDAFKVFDQDNDGYIAACDLQHIMLSLGEKLSIQEVEDMISSADTEGIGKINYNDFVKLLMSE